MVVCDVVKFIPSPWKGEGEGGGSALSGPQGLDPPSLPSLCQGEGKICERAALGGSRFYSAFKALTQ
jgi:hypothetical protein